MKSPILDSDIETKFVLADLRNSHSKGYGVREAKVTIPYYTSKITGDSWDEVETVRTLRELKGYQYTSGLNKDQKLIVIEPMRDYNYQEIDVFNNDIKIEVGSFLTRSGFDPYYKSEMSKKNPEPDIEQEREFTLLVKNTPLKRELDALLQKLHDKHGLPSEIKLPPNMENDKVYTKAISELTKLSGLFDSQSDFARINNLKPEYKGGQLDMVSDSYRAVKRSLAKNIAMQSTHGVLMETSITEDALELSARTARGKEVLNIKIEGKQLSDLTEHWEYPTITGDHVHMRVIALPESQNIAIKGSSIEQGALLLNNASKLRIVMSDTQPDNEISKEDIALAIKLTVDDLNNDGFSSIALSQGHDDMVNSKFTMALNKALNGALVTIAPEYISRREDNEVGLGM